MMCPEEFFPMNELITFQSPDDDEVIKDDLPVKRFSKTAEVFDFTHTNITRLLPAFGKLTSLTTIQMSGSSLVKIPSFFGNLTNLEEVTLTDNRIQDLPASFANLTKIKCLHLHSNCLNKIPDAVFELTSLTHLDIDNNPLQKDIVFPLTWTGMKWLSIAGCNQYSISPTINNLVNLTTLNMGHNYWQTLPSLEGLWNIKDLCFNHMKVQLRELPESIKHLKFLEFLECHSSGLCKLPDWLPNLSCLLELELSDNHLKEIPDNIGNMQSLSILELSNNQLRKIPKSLANIFTLEGVVFTGNPIDSFPIALYEQDPTLNLIADDPKEEKDKDLPALETGKQGVEAVTQQIATRPPNLEVQVARMLVKQKVKPTQADLSLSCLELINSAKECSTFGCNGIFIRGGGVEESTIVEFAKHIDDTWNRRVRVDKHTCDFLCTDESPQNRT